jgi:phage-related protein
MRVKFYHTHSGRSPIEEFIAEETPAIKQDFANAIDLLEAGYLLSMPLSRNLSKIHQGLHELRFKDDAGQVRVFYYIKHRESILMLFAFRKKMQKIPPRVIDLVLRRIKGV